MVFIVMGPLHRKQRERKCWERGVSNAFVCKSCFATLLREPCKLLMGVIKSSLWMLLSRGELPSGAKDVPHQRQLISFNNKTIHLRQIEQVRTTVSWKYSDTTEDQGYDKWVVVFETCNVHGNINKSQQFLWITGRCPCCGINRTSTSPLLLGHKTTWPCWHLSGFTEQKFTIGDGSLSFADFRPGLRSGIHVLRTCYSAILRTWT
jgi:hypothetical protein